MAEEPSPQRLTLADKLDQLFKTAHPRGRGELSYEEVAAGINARGGEISASYLWELRTGKKDNPRLQHLTAIADYFDVPTSYLIEEGEEAAQIHAELRLLAAMREKRIQQIAARALGLSPEALGAIADVVERLRDFQGLPKEIPGTPDQPADRPDEERQE